MKFIWFTLFTLTIIASCTMEEEQHPKNKTGNKITFIANHDEPDGEFVIKHMIRKSILEDEYTILYSQDTLELNTVGKSFFTVGERNRVLDTIIVDRGDVVTLTCSKGELDITSANGTIASNNVWYDDFYNQIEEAQKKLLNEIVTMPDGIEVLRNPLIITNDFEIIELRISHLYALDRTAYNQDKITYDEKLHNYYVAMDSLISEAQVDLGAKQILQFVLNNSTQDKFRRMGSAVQEWMYNRINEDVLVDCSTTFDTKISELYLNFLTEKFFQKITSFDLLKAYDKTHEIACPSFRQEIQRTCIHNLFLMRNKISEANKLLDKYVEETGDTDFYNLIEHKFGIYKSEFTLKENLDGLLVDIEEQEHQFSNIMSANKGKVVLVDFWASWCAPCRMGMPDVKNLEAKYAADDFEVVYVSIDAYPNPWKRAAKDEGIDNQNNYWASKWAQSDMHKKFGVKSIPHYILYDKSGKVAYQKAPKPDALDDIIDDLLGKS